MIGGTGARLIEAVTLRRSRRDEICRVVVCVLDDLGPDHPLATRGREGDSPEDH